MRKGMGLYSKKRSLLATNNVKVVNDMCQLISVTGNIKPWLVNRDLLTRTMETAAITEVTIARPTSTRNRIKPAALSACDMTRAFAIKV